MSNPGTILIGCLFALFSPAPAWAHLVNTNVGEFYAGIIHPLMALDHLLLTLSMALIAGQSGKQSARVALFAFPLVLLAGTAAGNSLSSLDFLMPATLVLLVAMGVILAQADRLRPTAVGLLSVLTGSILGYRSGMDMAASQVAFQFIPGVALNGFILVALFAAWIPKADSPVARRLRILTGMAFAVTGITLLIGFIEPSAPGARIPNQEDLLTMLKVSEHNLPIVAGILLAAFVWGAAHALTPGHGKAIVAAYLIGSRSTPWHALYLGLTVTLTHTVGVFALGLVALFASHYVMPEQLYPWLAAVSGLIVAVLGAAMFVSRLRPFLLHGEHLATGAPGHHHHQSGDHFHQQDAGHHHTHHHNNHHHQDGDNKIRHENDHSHSHHHGQDHSHLPPGADGAPVTWKSLLGLGVSGGLLPCPSAVVLLLASLSFNWASMGIFLVLAFSLGLAFVLSAVGLLFVKGGRIISGIPQFAPALRFLSVASAFVILGFGVWLTFDAVTRIQL